VKKSSPGGVSKIWNNGSTIIIFKQYLWKEIQFEKYYFLQCRRHCLCHTRKENGPLTRQEERAIAATEKRLTRAEAVQEYEQSFIFDQAKFTFRELSVFLMSMQAWGAATISCKGTWQKIGASLELASLLCGMDVCHILYEKKWRETNSSSPYLKLPNLKKR